MNAHETVSALAQRRHVGASARAIAIAAIVLGAGFAVYAERTMTDKGLSTLRHASPEWIAVAICCECISMVGLALMERKLLNAGGADLSVGSLLSTAYTSNALAMGVPVVGSALATAYTHREFRRKGLDFGTVSVALIVAGVISSVTLAIVVAVGAVLSGNLVAASVGLASSLGIAVVITGIVISLRSSRGRALIEPILTRVLSFSHRVVRRPKGDPSATTAAALKCVAALELGLSAMSYATICAVVNWVADVLCLAVAVLAVGGSVPWHHLILVWGAGVGAASFSPTPYGLGVVDVVLIAALSSAGVHVPQAVGAVLLYRVITFKFLTSALWVAYQHRRDNTRSVRGKGRLIVVDRDAIRA